MVQANYNSQKDGPRNMQMQNRVAIKEMIASFWEIGSIRRIIYKGVRAVKNVINFPKITIKH